MSTTPNPWKKKPTIRPWNISGCGKRVMRHEAEIVYRKCRKCHETRLLSPANFARSGRGFRVICHWCCFQEHVAEGETLASNSPSGPTFLDNSTDDIFTEIARAIVQEHNAMCFLKDSVIESHLYPSE